MRPSSITCRGRELDGHFLRVVEFANSTSGSEGPDLCDMAVMKHAHGLTKPDLRSPILPWADEKTVYTAKSLSVNHNSTIASPVSVLPCALSNEVNLLRDTLSVPAFLPELHAVDGHANDRFGLSYETSNPWCVDGVRRFLGL